MSHTTPGLSTLIDHYLAIWNEPDSTTRRHLIEQAWAEDGTFADPTQSSTGRDELDALVAGFQQAFPGHRCVLSTDGRHDNVFRWRLVSPTGETVVTGEDTVVLNDAGLLQAVHGIFVEA